MVPDGLQKGSPPATPAQREARLIFFVCFMRVHGMMGQPRMKIVGHLWYGPPTSARPAVVILGDARHWC